MTTKESEELLIDIDVFNMKRAARREEGEEGGRECSLAAEGFEGLHIDFDGFE